jgi:hypothetical protein
MLVAGGVIYGGIRGDLARMKADILENKENVGKCHDRLDHHLETQHNRRKED